jgi:hypothetical protein
MFKGELLPSEPQKSPEVHQKDGEIVPYTREEMVLRTAAYTAKKAIWDKTMKVLLNSALNSAL